MTKTTDFDLQIQLSAESLVDQLFEPEHYQHALEFASRQLSGLGHKEAVDIEIDTPITHAYYDFQSLYLQRVLHAAMAHVVKTFHGRS